MLFNKNREEIKVEKKQDKKLNKLKKSKKRVVVYLVSGNRLEGKIEGFDNFVLILKNNEKQMIIYKHAISTIKVDNLK